MSSKEYQRVMKYCCVAGCKNASFAGSAIKFFSFPSKNPAQRELWIAAVRRQSNEDPTKPWQPSKWSRICSGLVEKFAVTYPVD